MNVFRKLGVAVCLAVVFAWGASCGPVPCSSDAECLNGEACSDGKCQEITTDAGSDAGSGTQTCVPGSLCRPAIGDCDVAETCDASGQCPADSFAGVGQVCRAPAGPCDLEERCTGTSAACPADSLAPASTVCRSAAAGCDAEEKCSGTDAQCPADQILGAGVVCRPSEGACDVEEVCDGSAIACPADAFQPDTFVCRVSEGGCDPEEKCEGDKAACPANVISAAAEICRAAVNACDVAESCDGVSTSCPSDAFQPANTPCSASSCTNGETTPARSCEGSSATCTTVAPISCNGYQCSGNTCGTSCTTSTQCMSTHYCQPGNNQCAPKRVDGQPCSGAAFGYECASGACTASYTDADGDGYGVGTLGYYCGTTAPAGRASQLGDCCDSDSRARPGQTAFYTSTVNCGGYDFNCNGAISYQYNTTNACKASGSCSLGAMSCSGTTGWSSTTRPACGASALYVTTCGFQLSCNQTTCPGCEICDATTATRTQGCN